MKTKQHYLLSALIAFLFVLSGQAQDIDAIIKKHIDAHGGKDKWDAVQSLKVTGRFTSFSEVKTIHMLMTKEGMYRFDYAMGQHDVSEGFDGELAWTINPWFDVSHPYEALKPEIIVAKQRAEFCSPFYKYKERGYQVELLGTEVIEGVECFKIKLVRHEPLEETWYINTETYLEFKSHGYRQDFARLFPAEIYYDDFRDVDGLIIPFFREFSFIHRYRLLEYDKIETNVKVDSSVFTMPKISEMLKLKPLVGEWNVVLKTMNRRGEWAKSDSVNCSFHFVKNSSFIEGKMKYTNFFVFPKEYRISYSPVTEKYRLVVFNAFNTNAGVLEGTVSDTLFAFENTHIKYDSTYSLNAATKYAFKNFTPDSFLLEIMQSGDKGKNWRATEKFYFTRKE